MSAPHRPKPLSRRLGGVLAGGALSSLAVVTSLIVTWLDRDRVDADGAVLLLLAVVVGIPAFLLGAVALVLLSGRARSPKIVNTTTALAVLVALLPMGLIFLREVWAAFAFALLFAVLVSLVLTEPAERDPVEGSDGIQLSEVSQSPPQGTGESLPQSSSGNEADTSPPPVHRVPRYWRRRFSPGGRTAGRVGDPVRPRRRRERPRSVVRYGEHANPSTRTSDAESDSDALSQPQGPSNDLMGKFGVLIDRLESSLAQFERMLSDGAPVFQQKPPNNEDAVQAPIEDTARALMEERLASVCERIENSADRLDRLIAETDSRDAELLAAQTESMKAATSGEAEPAPGTSEALHSVQEDIADLVRELTGGQGPDDREGWLKRIRELRAKLRRCVESDPNCD